MRSDFRPNYWGMNPEIRLYHLCPKCGFCGTSKLYKKLIENKDVIEDIKSLKILQENYTLSEKIERAIKCLEILNKYKILNTSKIDFAYLWLKKFWWAEGEDELNKYGKIVIDFFKNVIETQDIEKEEKYKLMYLIGEINRRLGNTKEAHEIFEKLINELKENKNLTDLLRILQQKK